MHPTYTPIYGEHILRAKVAASVTCMRYFFVQKPTPNSLKRNLSISRANHQPRIKEVHTLKGIVFFKKRVHR
jgi:hypothetical protein